MADDEKKLRLEIAHILFIDIVGYSKLLVDEQHEQIRRLNEIVRATDEFRSAEEKRELIRLPTGDGMALVFLTDPEAPVQCAVEIAKALKSDRKLQLRMGIHSGPVNQVSDVNERVNVAGAGMNMAQRVMDCGDAGHILLSKRSADDLSQYRQWQPQLHDLGECEIKHGSVHLYNFFGENFGNTAVPGKIRGKQLTRRATGSSKKLLTIIATFAMLALLLGFGLFKFRRPLPTAKVQPASSNSSKSIAVLPFVDMSQAKDQEYFCDGISEELLDALAKVEGLRVVARTSSFSFKGKNADVSEVGNKLNVQNVLEGSLRREGNRIRITAQLINARDGFHLWSETYERELQSVFAVQDEITRAIVDALKIKLAVAPLKRPQRNTEAYDLFLKGRYYLIKGEPDAIKKAIGYFNQALEKDPNDALAYTGLADSYSQDTETMTQAKAAVQKALELDDTLAEAHSSLAYIKFHVDWDWAGTEKEFRRALELNPNHAEARHWYSHFLMAMGRINESLTESKRALELDQLDPNIKTHLGWHYLYARQYDLAIVQLQKTLEMDPSWGHRHQLLGFAYEQKAMYKEAAEEFRKAKEADKVTPGDIGHLEAVSGNKDGARKILGECKQERLSNGGHGSSYSIALIHAGLGEKDQALEWLANAYHEHSGGLVNLKAEPRFDDLRADPRFGELLRRMGLDAAPDR